MAPEAEFDLEKLFLPAWAQESPAVNRYSQHPGERPDRNFDDRQGGRRPPRRDGPRPGGGGDNRGPGGGPRPAGGPRPGGGQFGGPRPGGPGGSGGPGPRRDGPRPQRPGGGQDQFRRNDRPERRELPPPLPNIMVTLSPDDAGVESVARQIKISGRSFPLFDIAQMILQKPERQQVKFEVEKQPDGTIAQKLFVCELDSTLWLSENEAMEHLLVKHFATFYQTEQTPTDPPKGTYTFVAQCGMSGVILGPPNNHDYQNQLRKLHGERFSRMPFDAFKARVKIVKDEAVVKKWIADQSVKTEYVALNVPEPLRFANREEVDKHFREVHLPNIVKSVEKYSMTGPASRQLRSPELQRAIRAAWEDQKRFPLQMATVLSQQFAAHGLQFFKVNKTITHVSVARPHYLDLETTPVSEQVRRIVDFINATPKCTRRRLVDALVSKPAPVIPVVPTTAEAATAGGSATPAAPAPEPAPSPEQAALIGDLHWLIHQGHVIEFANGILETAKKPAPKPVRPPKPDAPAKPAGEEPAPATTADEISGAPAATEAAAPVETEAVTENPAVADSPAQAPAAVVSAPVEAPAPVAEAPASPAAA